MRSSSNGVSLITVAKTATPRDWRVVESERARLLLHRHILWLRSLWSEDPLARSGSGVLTDASIDQILAGPLEERRRALFATEPAAGVGRKLAALDADAVGPTAAPSRELDQLCACVGLDAFDRKVLALCLAGRLDPAVARLLAYANDDAALPYPTPALAAALFPEAARPLGFAASSPLRWNGLVSVVGDPTSPTCGFVLDDSAFAFLLGETMPPAEIEAFTTPIVCQSLARAQRQKAAEGAGALRRSGMRALVVTGPAASGVLDVAAHVADQLGLSLRLIDTGAVPAEFLQRRAALAALRRHALLHSVAYAIETKEGGPGLAWSDLAYASPRLAVATGTGVWRPGSAAVLVSLAPPSPDDQAEQWRLVLGEAADAQADTIKDLAHSLRLSPSEIAAVVASARAANPSGPAVVEADALRRACYEQAASALRGLATPIEPVHGWDDLEVPETCRRNLQAIVDQVRSRALVYGAWGMARGPRGRGITALFSGSSGTGKTLAAEVLAHTLGLTMQKVNVAALVSKYIGETEKNLERVFDGAERAGCILFFDEADAIFGKRSEVRDSHDRYANLEIDYLLQRMEDYHGLAILATNRKADIDRAFLRRLRFVVDFPTPGPELRNRIWMRSFGKAVPTRGLDFARLARLDLAGGSIRNAALNAAFLAAADGGTVTMDHVLRSTDQEFEKMDRLPPAGRATKGAQT
ncbi:MAG: ATP-binding protein [bacterium]